MKPTPDEIEKYLKLLAETPRRISSVSRNIESSHLLFKNDEALWSANDILAHLRSCADVWGKTIQEMLAQDKPILPYVHPRQWVKRTNYPELNFHTSLQAFTSQRKELLKLLKNLAFADWSRASTIKGREHTIFTQTRRMATHENEHCEQIKAILKSLI
ncbi:MAG: DinB family protein [Anaerolineales bacterium]|nr:DinB family protein [Anaerolineales bacterium]